MMENPFAMSEARAKLRSAAAAKRAYANEACCCKTHCMSREHRRQKWLDTQHVHCQ